MTIELAPSGRKLRPGAERSVVLHIEEIRVTRGTKFWLVVATLFTLINIFGVGFAAAAGEGPHAATHIALSLIGAFFMWRIARRVGEPGMSGAPLANERLDQLQQSVDAVAIEVERIGESQRFATRLAAERAQASPLKRP